MGNFFDSIIPLLVELLKSPAFYMFIVGLITTLAALFKVPGWVKDGVLFLIKKIIDSVKATEKKARTITMTSEEKLRDAVKRIENDPSLTAKEKKLMQQMGTERIIEKLALPVMQDYFKKEPI